MSLFKDNAFYNKSIQKFIAGFGNVFVGMTITEEDENCNTTKIIRVPIAYGPKNKWLSRLTSEPDLESTHVKMTMPRIAFEVTDYKFDPTRKIGTQGSYIPGKIGEKSTKVFNPVPYDVTVKMYTIAKDQEDSLRMLEQILPYFSPILEIKILQFPELGMMKSIPVQLDSVSVDDNYDSSVQTLRTVVQTFNFTAKLDLFGPIFSTDKVIKRTIIDISTKKLTQIDETYTAEVVPFDANKEDVYTIKENWEL